MIKIIHIRPIKEILYDLIIQINELTKNIRDRYLKDFT